MEIFVMSNFIAITSHCNTFLGIDLHTTAATYAAMDATSETLEKGKHSQFCGDEFWVFSSRVGGV